ncbi:hypothetical protein ACJMK2_012236, partial [Sinanodonta woodiana]
AQTSEIKNNSPPETPYSDPLIDVNVSPIGSSGSNRATFQGPQENIIPTVSEQKGHYALSNSGHHAIYMDINNPIHLESRHVKPENPVQIDDEINSSMSKRQKGKRKQRRGKNKEDHTVRAANENVEIPGNTDNHTGLDRYTNGEHSVPNKRTENPNDQSSYDQENRNETETNHKLELCREVTISDVFTTVSTVQDQEDDIIRGSDEVRNELNNNKNEIPIEKTRKHKRSRKRKKRNRTTLFDVPAGHPVVEMQSDIDKLGSRIQ